jgi:hypothetical protein
MISDFGLQIADLKKRPLIPQSATCNPRSAGRRIKNA